MHPEVELNNTHKVSLQATHQLATHLGNLEQVDGIQHEAVDGHGRQMPMADDNLPAVHPQPSSFTEQPQATSPTHEDL